MHTYGRTRGMYRSEPVLEPVRDNQPPSTVHRSGHHVRWTDTVRSIIAPCEDDRHLPAMEEALLQTVRPREEVQDTVGLTIFHWSTMSPTAPARLPFVACWKPIDTRAPNPTTPRFSKHHRKRLSKYRPIPSRPTSLPVGATVACASARGLDIEHKHPPIFLRHVMCRKWMRYIPGLWWERREALPQVIAQAAQGCGLERRIQEVWARGAQGAGSRRVEERRSALPWVGDHCRYCAADDPAACPPGGHGPGLAKRRSQATAASLLQKYVRYGITQESG